MNTIDTSTLLSQLRAMARDAGIPDSEASQRTVPKPSEGIEFQQVLQDSLQNVNTRNAEAKALREAFELGDPNVELTDVMVAAQKARISFEALTQVRNKMVAAYKEIMSMPL